MSLACHWHVIASLQMSLPVNVVNQKQLQELQLSKPQPPSGDQDLSVGHGQRKTCLRGPTALCPPQRAERLHSLLPACTVWSLLLLFNLFHQLWYRQNLASQAFEKRHVSFGVPPQRPKGLEEKSGLCHENQTLVPSVRRSQNSVIPRPFITVWMWISRAKHHTRSQDLGYCTKLTY